jgi:hypothetical protein
MILGNMKQFTDAILKALKDENWFAGLFIALCLPDICGKIEDPNSGVQTRYTNWFNKYLSSTYTSLFTADDCYYFRCACLHEGKSTHAKLTPQRIHFISPPPNKIHLNFLNNILQMQIDIFCRDMVDAVEVWMKNVSGNPTIIDAIKELMVIYPYTSLAPFININKD